MQVLEEEVVEGHRSVLDGLEVWRQQDATLLAMTNEVDYDQDAYAQLLEEMVQEKMEALAALAAKTRAFRSVGWDFLLFSSLELPSSNT